MFNVLDVTVQEVVQTLPETTDWGVEAIHAPAVWSKTRGAGVKIAVLDTGIDAQHPDLAGNVKGGINFTTPYPNDWHDVQGHGTHVAGIIGAIDNDMGVIGVAPEAELYAVKVLGDDGAGDFGMIMNGVRWAIANQMDIISMSLGTNAPPPAVFRQVFQEAYRAGIPVLVATGNSNEHVYWPAAYPETIAVVATDQANRKAVFSNYGDTTDIAAPGVDIYSTYPGGQYAKLSGTSMATPMVTGALALWMSQMKQQGIKPSVQEVIAALKAATIDLGAPGEDDQFGTGLIDLTKLV